MPGCVGCLVLGCLTAAALCQQDRSTPEAGVVGQCQGDQGAQDGHTCGDLGPTSNSSWSLILRPESERTERPGLLDRSRVTRELRMATLVEIWDQVQTRLKPPMSSVRSCPAEAEKSGELTWQWRVHVWVSRVVGRAEPE